MRVRGSVLKVLVVHHGANPVWATVYSNSGIFQVADNSQLLPWFATGVPHASDVGTKGHEAYPSYRIQLVEQTQHGVYSVRRVTSRVFLYVFCNSTGGGEMRKFRGFYWLLVGACLNAATVFALRF